MTKTRWIAAAWLALGPAALCFGQMAELPPVKAPVGPPGLFGPAVIGGPSAAGPTPGQAATVSLATTLPKPLIAVALGSGSSPRATAVAGSDHEKRTQALGGPAQAAPLASGEAPKAQATPVDLHARRFQLFMKDIMGKRAPNEKETRALLESYLEERGVPTDSQLAEAIEGRFLAPPEPVSPRFAGFAPGLRRLAKEHGVPVSRLEEMIVQNGLDTIIAGPRESDLLLRALDQALTAEAMRAAIKHYPGTTQGETLRNLAANVTARSGKSVEELARAGAFLYVDFHGRRVRNASSGRDPDVSSVDVVFYATMHDGRWTIEVYRQNNDRGVRGSDAYFEGALRDWLLAGGLTPDDLR